MNIWNNAQAPIGYWLKHADEVITRRVNAALSSQGVTRSHWQVMNILHQSGGADWNQVFQTMQTFMDLAGLNDIIEDLNQRGWITRLVVPGKPEASQLNLTAVGLEIHQKLLDLQNEVRKRAVQGVSEDEYSTVIRVLQKIVDNLENP
jgi:DNA-binding MarR family transcriptional regulator